MSRQRLHRPRPPVLLRGQEVITRLDALRAVQADPPSMLESVCLWGDRVVEDITGDRDALARAAGIVDQEALERVREKLRAVAEAEQALRRAVAERNQTLREAAAANPACRAAALAREVGLNPSLVTAALRGATPPHWGEPAPG